MNICYVSIRIFSNTIIDTDIITFPLTETNKKVEAEIYISIEQGERKRSEA